MHRLVNRNMIRVVLGFDRVERAKQQRAYSCVRHASFCQVYEDRVATPVSAQGAVDHGNRGAAHRAIRTENRRICGQAPSRRDTRHKAAGRNKDPRQFGRSVQSAGQHETGSSCNRMTP